MFDLQLVNAELVRLACKTCPSNMINRYMRLMSNTYNLTAYTEKHHILPKSMYPDYQNLKWNKVVIPARVHYLAHWMLSKILGGTQWFAFNQMKRILPKNIMFKRSALYTMSRVYIAEQSRICNTGREKSIVDRTGISRRVKNTVVVRNVSGDLFRVNVSDSRYKSGELVYYATGSHRTDETKKKMSVSASQYNKGVKYHNVNTGAIRYFKNDPGDEWRMGLSESTKQTLSTKFRGSSWYHNALTGKDIRIFTGDVIPTGLLKGRKNGCGWSKINDKRVE